MSIEQMISKLKNTPEGDKSPQTVAILEAMNKKFSARPKTAAAKKTKK